METQCIIEQHIERNKNNSRISYSNSNAREICKQYPLNWALRHPKTFPERSLFVVLI